jgi:precorrin-2 dehydrogenase/sirohydrochlorin ferrochelatase
MMLDVTDLLSVIVGGGGVAVRKAKGLLAAGASRIRVVSPTFSQQMPQEVQRIAEPYAPHHLAGATLVFAATDSPEVNATVVRDAHAAGALACRADIDEQEPGDFATPAMLRSGPIAIGVSAAGSPALAAALRDELAQRLDPRWAKLAEAMQLLRPIITDGAAQIAAERRRRIFEDLATPDALAVVAAGGVDELWRWIAARFPELGALPRTGHGE